MNFIVPQRYLEKNRCEVRETFDQARRRVLY